MAWHVSASAKRGVARWRLSENINKMAKSEIGGVIGENQRSASKWRLWRKLVWRRESGIGRGNGAAIIEISSRQNHDNNGNGIIEITI
jgi:hypothetical protein